MHLPKTLEKCTLREIVESDAQDIAEIEYDEELKEYFRIPEMPKSEFIEKFASLSVKGLVIESNENGLVAGTIDRSAYKGDKSQQELRIFLKKEYWGKGIAYETVQHIVNWIFGANFVNCVVAVIDPRNKPSIGLFTKAGFEKTAESDSQGKFVYLLSREAHDKRMN